MNQTNASKILPEEDLNKQTDNTYLSVNIYNDPSYGPYGSPAEYNVTKDQPLLSNVSEYYMYVARYTLSLSTVPLYIMPAMPDQANPNLTPFVVGFRYNGVNYPEPLIYVVYGVDTPPVQDQPNMVVTSYYYVYSYQLFVDILNTALRKAIAASGANIFGSNGEFMPYFNFDEDSKKLELIYPNTFLVENDPPVIFCNHELANWLNGFPMVHRHDPSRSFDIITCRFDANSRMVFPTTSEVFPNKLATFPAGMVPGTASTMFVSKQEYATVQNWNSVRRIAITTETIPIRKESVPIFGRRDNHSATSVGFPVISDYALVSESAGDNRSMLNYIPQGALRLIDMVSDAELRTISLKFYWVDSYENIRPIMIPANNVINIKLGFIRKSLIKNKW